MQFFDSFYWAMTRRFVRGIAARIYNLNRLGSVNWFRLFGRILTLPSDYRRADGVSRSLVNVTYEVTYRCNQRCKFCFLGRLRRRLDSAGSKEGELRTDEALRLIDSVAELGAGLYLTGGEPLLRDDIVTMVARAKQSGAKCGINTNGVLLTEQRAKAFAECGLDYLIVSIVGRKEIHDEVVGLPGSYDAVTRNLRFMQSLNSSVRVVINFVISPDSVFNLKDVIRLASDLGVGTVTCQHMQFLTREDLSRHDRVWGEVMPAYSVSPVYANPPRNHLPVETLEGELEDALRLARRLGVRCVVKPPLRDGGLRVWYEGPFRVKSRCYYPWTDTRVAPNGDVYPCQFLPVRVGNIREKPLGELLNSRCYRDFRVGLRKAGGLFPACARCCKIYRDPLARFRGNE